MPLVRGDNKRLHIMIKLRLNFRPKDLSLHYFAMLATCVCFIMAHPSLSFPPQAQAAAPITPSGLNTQVNLSATPPSGMVQNDITGGTRPGGGVNLFHSFGDFSVPTNNIANFLNTGSVDLAGSPLAAGLPTSNILGRITGSNISNIFGTIQTTDFGNANLFLMNPAGFLFGQDATVNVGGMMTFTTADDMRLRGLDGSNAGILHADTAQTSILTSAPVAAFGFIGSNPHSIDFIGGQLTVAEGTGLALIGGDISLAPDSSVVPNVPSSIIAPGRTIQITSVAGMGTVAADTGIPAVGMALGTVTLDQGTTLDTSYISGASLVGDGSGGAISIRGGQLVATGSTITTSPALGSTGVGGEVTIAVTGSAAFTDSQIQTLTVRDFVSFVGSAGAVSVTANEGLVMTRTMIDASALFAGGDAGPVTFKTDRSLSLTDSLIITQASAPGNGGAVTITGKDVTLNNSIVLTDVDTGIFDVASDPAMGQVRPGAVTVTAQDTLTLSGSARGNRVISATAFGTLLDAGAITITGKTVNLSNGTIAATLSDGGIVSPANGGTIEIRGNNVNSTRFELVSNADNIQESSGTGGTILIRGADNLRAENIQLANTSVNTASAGGGGPIEFQTKALTMSDHTEVATSSFGSGAGGTITVRGAETVTIESGSRVVTDVVIGGAELPQGSAGSILFETQNLTLRSGGQIDARALPNSTGNAGNIVVQGHDNKPAQSILIDGTGSGIFSTAEGTGAGGNITLNANTVVLQNGGTLSAKTSGAEATATGGSITVTTTDHVTMTGGASITASSTDPGNANAGDILINAGQQFDMRDSSITAKATQASGGNIDIRAVDRVRLINSEISSSVQGGASTAGGNITIDPNVIVLQDSDVTAKAVQGTGGNITLTTPLFLADSTSQVDASSQFGVNGRVTIQSPTSNLSGSLGPLTSTPNQAQSLLTQRCAALANGQASSFVVTGREQLPTDPGGWLSSPLAFTALGVILETDNTVTSAPAIMTMATHDTGAVSLRRLTPAGFLMANFAGGEATGCHS